MAHPDGCCENCGVNHFHWCLHMGYDKCDETFKEKPLMHNGVEHGTVHGKYGDHYEMDIHLDTRTGDLLDKAKELKDMGTHVEIVL